MPQTKRPAWTEFCSMCLDLGKEKFLDMYFDNILSFNYLPTAS